MNISSGKQDDILSDNKAIRKLSKEFFPQNLTEIREFARVHRKSANQCFPRCNRSDAQEKQDTKYTVSLKNNSGAHIL